MKPIKYKLIKEYPGSPELNTELSGVGLDYDLGTYHYPKQYPEFWEEVVEKDYEILSFKNTYGYILRKDSQINKFCIENVEGPFYSENDLIINKFVSIHSVKRLSDNEIFTIGDTIKGNRLNRMFFAPSNLNDIVLDCSNMKRALYIIEDSHIKVDKIPLFTTEDGIDIFDKNCKVGYLYKNDLLAFENTVKYALKFAVTALYFSNKDKAEKYILYNKPCISINDVKDVIGLNVNTLSILEKLVKNKLNK